MSTHYKKVGRRYEPVSDSEAYRGLSNGCWLVTIDKGCTTIRQAVQPNMSALQFAALMMSNKISKYLMDVGAAIPKSREYTKNQKKILKQLQDLPEKDKLMYWEYDSIQGMADNILKLILEDYESSKH